MVSLFSATDFGGGRDAWLLLMGAIVPVSRGSSVVEASPTAATVAVLMVMAVAISEWWLRGTGEDDD